MNADVSLTPGRRMPTFGTIATRTTPSNTCAPTPTRSSVTTNGSCGSSFPTTPCELTEHCPSASREGRGLALAMRWTRSGQDSSPRARRTMTHN
jgi:hypothetical protein